MLDVIKVWVLLSVYLSVQTLYGTAIALYLEIYARQNSTHLTLSNIKIPQPPYMSSLKIVGFLALF